MAPRVTSAQIAAWARARGLDPDAVLRVAGTEGLSGGIGDSGHAFGPFQLNNAGGAYPSWAPQDPNAANDWAWSPQGVQYALAGIQKVAAGTRGADAVRNIVTRFERPANPSAEISKALAGQAVVSPAGSYVPGTTPSSAAWTGVLGVPDKIIGTPYSGTHTLGNWESDNAVDLAAPTGTPVYAAQPGTIGPQFGSLGQGGRFAGLRLHLDTPGNEFYYAHLSKFAPGIHPGTSVRRGQILGYSGEANGVGHLHFGAEHGDPRTFIGPGGTPSSSFPTPPAFGAAAPASTAGVGSSTVGVSGTTPQRRPLPAAVQQALRILRS